MLALASEALLLFLCVEMAGCILGGPPSFPEMSPLPVCCDTPSSDRSH